MDLKLLYFALKRPSRIKKIPHSGFSRLKQAGNPLLLRGGECKCADGRRHYEKFSEFLSKSLDKSIVTRYRIDTMTENLRRNL